MSVFTRVHFLQAHRSTFLASTSTVGGRGPSDCLVFFGTVSRLHPNDDKVAQAFRTFLRIRQMF
jgi:hypothetical protein